MLLSSQAVFFAPIAQGPNTLEQELTNTLEKKITLRVSALGFYV